MVLGDHTPRRGGARVDLPRLVVIVASAAAILARPLPAAEPAAAAGQWHVSATGDDAGDGTAARPFATLERALAATRAAREANDATPREVFTIHVAAGIHRRTGPLMLDDRDSGVRIVGPAEGTASLHAGRVVEPEQLRPLADPAMLERADPAARESLVTIDLAALGIRHLGPWPDTFRDAGGIVDLFWNGSPLPLARWPDDGPTTMAEVLDRGAWSRAAPRRPGRFVAGDDRLARWNVADGLWLEGYWRVPWEPHLIRVASIDAASRTIEFAVPIWGGIGSKYAPRGSLGSGTEPWWAVNLVEEIDRPGEWCLHFPSQRLILWPPEPEPGDAQPTVFLADVGEPLVTISGGAGISLERLTLEGGLGDGVTIEGGRGHRVAGCLFRNLGGTGVAVRGGSDHAIESCDLHTLGSAGIRLAGGDRAGLVTCGHRAINNRIHHVGRWQKTYAAAIHVGEFPGTAPVVHEAVGCRLAHNLMHDLPHAAVLYSGNDHRFEFNEVARVALTSRDVGAFYTRYDWTSQGTVLRHNLVRDSPAANAFYVDDSDSGDTIEGNVVIGCRCGPFIGGGHDNVVRDNLVVDCEIGMHLDARGVARGYATNATLRAGLAAVDAGSPPWSERYPRLARLADLDTGLPHGNIVEGNLAVGCRTPFQLNGTAEELADNRIVEPTVLGLAEAGFIAADRLDFRPRPQAAWRRTMPGVAAIPFDRIGLRIDEYRRSLPPRRPR